MGNFEISNEGVHKLLRGLNPNNAPAPDQMKPLVLRELADQITKVVTKIFSSSLRQQTIPDDCRSANICQVYKKCDKSIAVSYRPVSLTCIISKQMDHVIASKIMSHMNVAQQLYVHQHSFRSILSYETQLVEFPTDILKSLHDDKQCDDFFMDFSKAFGKVSHISLLYTWNVQGSTVQQ